MNKVLALCKNLLIPIVLFAPIWYSPVRTAPLKTHVTVATIVFIVALFVHVTCQRQLARMLWLQMLLIEFIGGGLALILMGPIWWSDHFKLGEEGKLVGVYFIGAVYWWFMLTHRKPGEVGFNLGKQ